MPADPQVLADPFFGVVRRRHPDVDIVLLPPDQGSATHEPIAVEPLAVEPLAVESFREVSARDLSALDEAVALVGGDHAMEQESDEGWAPGPDGLHRRRLFAASGIDAVRGSDLVAAAARLLGERGWQVAEPGGSGLPRLVARAGRCHLRLLYVLPARRLALTTDAGPYLLDPADRDDLLGRGRES